MGTPIPRSAGASQPAHDRPPLFHIATLALRYRRVVATAPAAAVAALLAISLAWPRSYTSVVSFVPQSISPSRLSGLASLSAQLGIGSLPVGSSLGSPDFYKSLLQTREILGQLVDTHFDVDSEATPFHGTLADFWDITGRTPALRRDKAIRKLDQAVSISVEQRTQMVELHVRTTSPHLSQQVAQRAVDMVGRFNQEKLQSQSAQEARFVGQRLEQAKRELHDAEDTLAQFMERNRDFRNSPPLTFQYDRLQRDVSIRQTLFATLSQSFEQSRIEEVRDTPVITIVQPPEAPPRPDSLQLLLRLPLAFIAGLLVAMLVVLTGEFFRDAPRPDDDQEFSILLEAFLSEARRPWKLLGWPR